VAKGYRLNHIAAFVCWLVLVAIISQKTIISSIVPMVATSGPILVYESSPVILWSELGAQVIIIAACLYVMFNLVKGGYHDQGRERLSDQTGQR